MMVKTKSSSGRTVWPALVAVGLAHYMRAGRKEADGSDNRDSKPPSSLPPSRPRKHNRTRQSKKAYHPRIEPIAQSHKAKCLPSFGQTRIAEIANADTLYR